MADLHLNLKGEYFDAIDRIEKNWEYRLYSDYWKRSLIGKRFDRIILKRGYPKKDDFRKQLVRPCFGYVIKRISHPHFGSNPVTVFAIKVN